MLYRDRELTTAERLLQIPAHVGYDLARLASPLLRTWLERIAVALAPMLVIATLVVMGIAHVLRLCWQEIAPRSEHDWQTIHALGRGLLVILLAPVALLGLLAHLSLVPLAEATTWWQTEYRVERLPEALPAGPLARENGIPVALPCAIHVTEEPYTVFLHRFLSKMQVYQEAA
jgi:hypothetical protein